MGVNLKELIDGKEISMIDLRNKKIAIDGYNMLYQFLSNIRQVDGTLLMDSKGRITSHLVGMFFRTTNLLENFIFPVFVFDGKPPEEKFLEQAHRKKLKEEAMSEYLKAKERNDIEAMKKYASRTSKLTKELVEEAKKLAILMGCPVVDAKSEGEAQAAYMARKGDVYGVASQDYDSLLFGSPVLIRNLTITGKRKLPNKPIYVDIQPEIIELKHVLEKNKITREQLIAIALLVGTDFNPGGIKGIGVKKALSLIKENSIEEVFEKVGWNNYFDVDWKHIYNIFTSMEVNKDYSLEWKEFDKEAIINFLVEEHDFTKERVERALSRLDKVKEERKQSSLSKFLK